MHSETMKKNSFVAV